MGNRRRLRNTIDGTRLQEGMSVYGGEGELLGPLERIDADAMTVMDQRYAFGSIERLEADRVYLTRQVGASTDRARGRSGRRGHTPPGRYAAPRAQLGHRTGGTPCP